MQTISTSFNEGKTHICMAENTMNMWNVWREDSSYVTGVKQYTDKKEALEDYNKRVSFLQQVTA